MLNDLKILDFSGLLPGPFGTLILADLGAEVISIKNPEEKALFDGFEIFNATLNRNKKIIELDLKKDGSIQKIIELIKEYDIIIEGFRPGVMNRFGLGYNDLVKINQSIIYCSITGYGQTGNYASRAGHDINYLSLSGIASYTGTKQSGPSIPGIQMADLSGSLYLAISVLSAYIHRQKTGQGQFIDLSMTDCVFSLGILQNLRHLSSHEIPNYEDSFLTGGSYYGYYKTKDNRYLSVGSLEPKFYIKLCEYFEIDYKKHPLEVKELLNAIFSRKSFMEWKEELFTLDICIEPVLNLDEVVDQEFFKSRENVTFVDVANVKFLQQTHPVKYSNYEPKYKSSEKLDSSS